MWFGVEAAFAAHALSYIVFLVALSQIHVVSAVVGSARQRALRPICETVSVTRPRTPASPRFGIADRNWCWRTAIERTAAWIAADVFRSGAGGLSILASAIGGGAILGGLWLGHRAHSSGLTSVVLGGALTGALAAIMAIATESMWIAVPAVVVFGFCMSTSGIAIQTIIQLAAGPHHAWSRHGSLWAEYLFRGAPAVGALAAGLASAQFGLRWPVFFGALLVVAVCFWTYLIRERIRSHAAE